jgi:hypothetical protein
MTSRWSGNQSGTVVIFTILSLSFMLILGGIAFDLAYVSTVKGEVQRSMDAAALAAAGQLAFGSYRFSPARDAAVSFAGLNASRRGTVELASANIEVGIYDGAAFRMPVDATEDAMVNAVRCRYATTVPASFLRLLGFDGMPVQAYSVAVASPPRRPPANTCLFPVGISRCVFEQGGGVGASARGCGAPIAFAAVYGAPGAPPGPALTAAWVDIPTTGATMGDRAITAISEVYSSATCNFPLQVGDQIPAATKLTQAPTVTSQTNFLSKFLDVINAPGPSTAYRGYAGAFSGPTWTPTSWRDDLFVGKAWRVWVPVIDIGGSCSPTAVTGNRTIVGWTRLVITGVYYQGPCHGVVPPSVACGTPSGDRTIHGYVECPEHIDAPYYPSPAPISALSRRLHLVE